MKKIAILLTVMLLGVFAFASCTPAPATSSVEPAPAESSEEPAPAESSEEPAPAESSEEPAPADIHQKSEGVLTYAEYAATADNTDVVIETFVQDMQSWWNDKATIYTQDKDGAYFLYNAACSQELYDKLVPGQKIRVTGTKTSWSGEVELAEGATIEVLEGNYIAPAFDATSIFADKDELEKHMNQFVTFKGLKVEPKGDDGLPYFRAWDNSGADTADADLYLDVSIGEAKNTFVVEYYLRNQDSDAYKAVTGLKVGDTIDIEGFLYWYEGPQVHITSVTVK